jgi:hypothetical protein
MLSIVQKPTFATQYQSTSVREEVVISLQMFCGLAISVDETTSLMIFQACSRHFETFVKLLELYHSYADLELFILTFFKDLVKNISFDVLQPVDHQLIYKTIHDIIQVYAKNEIGRHRVHNAAEEDELYEDLSVLLQLLADLISAEYEGYGNLFGY